MKVNKSSLLISTSKTWVIWVTSKTQPTALGTTLRLIDSTLSIKSLATRRNKSYLGVNPHQHQVRSERLLNIWGKRRSNTATPQINIVRELLLNLKCRSRDCWELLTGLSCVLTVLMILSGKDKFRSKNWPRSRIKSRTLRLRVMILTMISMKKLKGTSRQNLTD